MQGRKLCAFAHAVPRLASPASIGRRIARLFGIKARPTATELATQAHGRRSSACPNRPRPAPVPRSPMALCSSADGPLRPAGTTVLCGTTKAGRFVAAPKIGRYVTIQLASRVARATSTLALAEISIFARRECPCCNKGGGWQPEGETSPAGHAAATMAVATCRPRSGYPAQTGGFCSSGMPCRDSLCRRRFPSPPIPHQPHPPCSCKVMRTKQPGPCCSCCTLSTAA